MKKIVPKERDSNKLNIPYGKMAAHDWFVCLNCGHERQMLVQGNYAHCPECGGTMKRK